MTKASFLDKFIELFKSSAVIQGSIGLISITTICILYLRGNVVPDSLLMIVATVLGYYFGVKTQQRVGKDQISNVTQ